jgi:hypothetical protein
MQTRIHQPRVVFPQIDQKDYGFSLDSPTCTSLLPAVHNSEALRGCSPPPHSCVVSPVGQDDEDCGRAAQQQEHGRVQRGRRRSQYVPRSVPGIPRVGVKDSRIPGGSEARGSTGDCGVHARAAPPALSSAPVPSHVPGFPGACG